MIKLPVSSLSSVKGLITFNSSRRLLPIAAATTRAAVNRRLVFARVLSSSSQVHQKMGSEYFMFGPYKIHHKEVFYSTDLSYAMVNLRPVVPGHILFMPMLDRRVGFDLDTYVLICPRREVKRFVDLSADETSDLWITAQKVGSRLENHHKASSLTLTIQLQLHGLVKADYQAWADPETFVKDGPQAGQTVPHVHIHVIPRKSGDFEKNDEIYDAIDEKEKELKQKLDLDEERKDRSLEEMAQEAAEYRNLF